MGVKEISIELKRSAEDQVGRVDRLRQELAENTNAVQQLAHHLTTTQNDNKAILKQIQQLESQSGM